MNAPRTIRASEVGRYAYCARAWWLQYVQRYPPQNAAALGRGLAAHAAHGQAANAAHRLAAMARALLWVAAFLAGLMIYASLPK
jgi:hypothetical protein